MNALVQLNHLPETREQQKTFIESAIGELISGEYDLMEFWVKATILSDTLDKIKSSTTIKNMVLNEAQKYNNQYLNGCKVQVVSKKSYDFDECNYAELDRLRKVEAETKESIKKIETMLKSLVSPMVDEETGEVVKLPIVNEIEYVKIT